jgi:curved DNA-binding protein CbpA
MNPYEVLGVPKNADAKAIKAAYRKQSAVHHPDKEGGSDEAFNRVALAHEVLSDPARRYRYDTLGRLDASRVTPERVKLFIQDALQQVIDAERPDGSTDDPERENIRDKMMLGLAGARMEIARRIRKAKVKLKRAERLAVRFKTNNDFDPITEILKAQLKRLEQEVHDQEDALELSEEVDRVLKTYVYQIDPWAEGQHTQGPTSRRGGTVMLGFGNDPSRHIS